MYKIMSLKNWLRNNQHLVLNLIADCANGLINPPICAICEQNLTLMRRMGQNRNDHQVCDEPNATKRRLSGPSCDSNIRVVLSPARTRGGGLKPHRMAGKGQGGHKIS